MWKTIDSAPRDGVMIIGRESDGSIHRALYDDNDGQYEAEWWNFDADCPSSAKHWMPLPQPPELRDL